MQTPNCLLSPKTLFALQLKRNLGSVSYDFPPNFVTFQCSSHSHSIISSRAIDGEEQSEEIENLQIDNIVIYDVKLVIGTKML